MPEQTRDVSGFDTVDLRGAGKLFVEQGDQEGVRIVAEEDAFDKIITEVEGTTLVIKLKFWDALAAFRPLGPLEYHVTAKDLRSIQVHGAGSVEASAATDTLELLLTGAGEVRAGVRADRLDSTVSGAGSITVRGEAAQQNVTVSGMGEHQADALETKETKVSISGAGKARVNASDRLDVAISGAGSVDYLGEPQVEQRISGLGSVNKVG